MGISFSKYVSLLIEKDFQERKEVGSLADLVRPIRSAGAAQIPSSESLLGSSPVNSEGKREALAKLGVLAAGIQPRAKGESSPQVESPSVSKAERPHPIHKEKGIGSIAQAPAPKQSAMSKPKPSPP